MTKWLLAVLMLSTLCWAQAGPNPDQNCAAWGATAPASNLQCNASGPYASGAQIFLPDIRGTITNQFEIVVIGTAPATLTTTVVGCMRGGTCSGTLASSSGTASQIIAPAAASLNIYDKYGVTLSWTGGDATTRFVVNRTGTVAKLGGTSTFQTGVNKPGNPTHVIDASAYGVLSDNVIGDASTTNTSQIVTSPNNDGNFLTTAAVGQVVYAQSACGVSFGTATTTTIVPVGTISSVDSNQQIHVSIAATATQVATACLAWGPDNSSALDTAYQAATAVCANLQLPFGLFFTKQPQFNYASGSATCNTFNLYRQTAVWGYGPGSTMIIPTPDFSFTAGHGCGSWSANNATGGCFFGVAFQPALYLQINGLGSVGANYGGATNRALVLNNGAYMFDVVFGAWCGLNNCGNSIGYAQIGQETQGIVGGAQFIGQSTCAVLGGAFNQMINWPCFGSQTGLVLSGNADLVGIGNEYTGTGTGGGEVLINAGSKMVSMTDSNSGSLLGMQVSGTLELDNFQFQAGGFGGGDPVVLNGGIVKARNNTYSSSVSVATGGVFLDDGLNSYIATPFIGTCAGNCVFQSMSATGTACATGNWALTSGWGTSSIASVTAGGDSHRCQVVITGAAGAASPVLTWTFPTAYARAPGSCQISFNGTLTGESTGAPSTTSVAFTFTGTPSAQTYRLDADCGP